MHWQSWRRGGMHWVERYGFGRLRVLGMHMDNMEDAETCGLGQYKLQIISGMSDEDA